MTDIAFKSALELVADIRARRISSRELTEHYIARIEKYDKEINAVVVHDYERALASADAADAALGKGEDLGVFHGLPMTIKEAYNIEGLPTTWGIPEMTGNIAATDAESVKRLKRAGAHFMGKTNVPLNLADFQSYNDIYGQTGNPWNLERTPGGSSGGSAAALAAGLTGLEAGSDIGGSIRNPAHYCGIYGHKPTWGVVPPQGHSMPGVLMPPDIAVVGPMARSAEDLAASMDVVAGADPDHAPGWQLNLPRPAQKSLKDFRVAVLPSHDMAPVSAEMSERVTQVADVLAKNGAVVADHVLPDIDFDHSLNVYIDLLQGVMAQGLVGEAREAAKTAAAEVPADDQSIGARMTRAAVQDHGAWMASHNQRFHLRQQWRKFFEEWDILICPQVATTAFPHDHGDYMGRELMVDNESQPYFQQLFWAGIVTVAHLPSTCFPSGPSAEGLPIGLQAVGAEFNDYTTIEFTRLLAEEIGGFVPPPAYS